VATMKFLTRDWVNGELSDAEAESLPGRYQQYLAGLLPGLPGSVRQLATELNLHDGLIRSVRLNRISSGVLLALTCGDAQTGYFDLEIHYSSAELAPPDVATLRTVTENADTEILYDEIDVSDGRYIHRLLFSPEGEIEIRFQSLAIQVAPRPNRDIAREGFLAADD
jgi:hypothetical protein